MQYEIAILYDQGLEVDLSKAESRVKKIFTDNGGKVTDTDNWGKKKLAYPINKQDHAVYVFYTVTLPTEAVSKVETTLNITDEVVRYLIVKQDEKTLAKIAAAQAQKEKAEQDKESKEHKKTSDASAKEETDEAKE